MSRTEVATVESRLSAAGPVGALRARRKVTHWRPRGDVGDRLSLHSRPPSAGSKNGSYTDAGRAQPGRRPENLNRGAWGTSCLVLVDARFAEQLGAARVVGLAHRAREVDALQVDAEPHASAWVHAQRRE